MSMCVLMVVLVVMGGFLETAVGLNAAKCEHERKMMVNGCKSVLSGKSPSAYCCKRLRVSHFSCICPVITPIVNINKAVKILKACGRKVPKHLKCGSITFP
ncbi:hypothetical protein GIB67_028430 [Kingdonia uniflora]|nr:hypothetical protein GIB67_039400 [Kingdonia uniflora]KAF6152388.1 hypothetical protein GIB67_028430 [Kingdonia uniflora]